MDNRKKKQVISIFFIGLGLMTMIELGLVWAVEGAFSSSWPRTLLGLGMAGAGMALVVWSVRTLYAMGKGTPAPMVPTQYLVQAGPYRWSRNPMTLGASLFYLGLAVWAGSWAIFGLVIIIFSLLLTYIYIHESRELAERFGVEYQEYRRKIPFLFPRIPR